MDWILPTLIFLMFCISHSFFAEKWIKERVFSKFQSFKPFYRISYSILSILLLGFWVWTIPNQSIELYTLPIFFETTFLVIKVLAIILFLIVLFKFDVGSFAGTKQVRKFLIAKKAPGYLDEPEKGELITSGIQKYIRHPLYSFAIIFMIADSSPTSSYAYAVMCLILYFWIGSYFEERKLIERFGTDYVDYKTKTGRFFPNILKIKQ